MDAAITLENISEIPVLTAIIFSCGPLIMYASLILEEFFGRPRISPINPRFKLSFLVGFLQMVHNEKLLN